MTLIYFVLVLGITVLIHEFGHFVFAKKAGIYVYEFSIGMGPRIFKFKRKNDETTYSIRLFPIGGFVSMAGESVEEDQNIPKDRSLQAKTWGQRFMTMAGGVLFNFILAIVLFFIVGLVAGSPGSKTYVTELESDLPASEYLKVGDEITHINGKKITSPDYLSLELAIVKPGDDITFGVKHEDGTKDTYTITPKKIEEDGEVTYKYGFGMGTKSEKGFLSAVIYGFRKTKDLLQQMILMIFYLITGKLGFSSLSGPIGIYNVVGASAKAGFINIVFLTGYLSTNVGFINFLPVPAFDGGRILFLIIEKIKGSPVNPKLENTIHSIGFALLMLLMLVVTWNDIVRFF